MLGARDCELYIREHVVDLVLYVIELCIFGEDDLRISLVISFWVDSEGRVATHWECVLTDVFVVGLFTVEVSKSVDSSVFGLYML